MGEKVFIFFLYWISYVPYFAKKKKVIYFIPKTPYDREKNSYSTYIFIKGFLGHFSLVILYPLENKKMESDQPVKNRWPEHSHF